MTDGDEAAGPAAGRPEYVRPRRREAIRDWSGRVKRREGLIVRWIGASRRRRKKPADPVPEGARSNVIVLADARPCILVRRPARAAAPSARRLAATLLPFARPQAAPVQAPCHV